MFDKDYIGKNVIGNFQYAFQNDSLQVNGGSKYYRKILKNKISQVTLEIEIGCDKNFYGQNCSVKCVEDEYRLCLQNGRMACRDGHDCNVLSKL